MSRFVVSFSGRALDEASRIDPSQVTRIQEAIATKLLSDPERFGKPLRYTLSGMRSLRVGDWRIAFGIQGNMVRIVSIFHRSKGYDS